LKIRKGPIKITTLKKTRWNLKHATLAGHFENSYKTQPNKTFALENETLLNNGDGPQSESKPAHQRVAIWLFDDLGQLEKVQPILRPGRMRESAGFRLLGELRPCL